MSYTGNIVEIPLGPAGLYGGKNTSQVGVEYLIEALNVSYESGVLQKEGGSSKYNSSAISGAPEIMGGWDWWPDTSTQRMIVVASDGKIYKDSGLGTFPVTLKSGLTATNIIPTFVEGGKEVAANNRKLFIFTGKNVVQVLSADGATTANITTPPADWSAANQPVSGAIHEARLWGWGNLNDAYRVYYSTIGNHEDFTGAGSGSISVYPGEGEKLVAGISYKGGLILWKFPVGLYFIDTTDPTIANWKVSRITQSIGAASPLAVIVTDDDALYLDKDLNFQLLSATTEFGDVASRNLSTIAAMNEFVRTNLNFARAPYVRGIYYSAKREAHFAVAKTAATTNTGRLVVDFNRLDLPRFRFSDKDTCQALWLKKDSDGIQRPISGDTVGFVWNLDQSNKSKDAVGYQSRFQTQHDDFSRVDPALANKRKNGEFLELTLSGINLATFYIDLVWDGILRQTVVFAPGVGGKWGSAVFGTGLFGKHAPLKRRVMGGGRRLSLIGRNGIAGEDFLLSRAFLHFNVGDERV